MKRVISEDEKIRLVRKVNRGTPLMEVCKTEGVSRSALYRWMKLYTSWSRCNGKKAINLQQVYQMERKLAILEEEVQIFRKSGCGINSSNDEKIAAIRALRGEFTVFAICRTLQILGSTFYQREKGPEKTWFEIKEERLRPAIQKYFDESKGRFDASKIAVKLREDGIVAARKHISKLMKEMGLVSKQKQPRFFVPTNRMRLSHLNQVQRNFTPEAPNKIWVSDITYMPVVNKLVPICVIIDLYARKVLSYTISERSNTALVLDTFQKAYDLRNPQDGVIFHSDRGTQYRAQTFQKKLKKLKFVQSFSNPATPYDNAVAESFFSIMKREELSHNIYHSMEDLDKTVADFIEFFNGYRPLHKLGDIPPNQYESQYWECHQ